MTLSGGSRLGPYEILSPIGAGGMGEVYKARDTRLERTVAVKVLSQHLSSSPDVRQRFEREAKTISQLSHPHICALYDVGSEGETEYLVMEYLEGETLSDRLSKGSLPLEQTLRYGTQMAEALEKAHRQGVVHRDLKPGNVMLTTSGVKLLDFGLAKAIAAPEKSSALTSFPTVAGSPNLTQEGTILGTFQYMAPEQLEGKEADARTDIFALGAVLYEMATGRKAFSGTSQASLISSIMKEDPSPISTIAPMSPPALDRAIRTCLAKDPEDRWQSARDVGNGLRWAAEEGSKAGVPAPVARGRWRREAIAWTIAALTSLGLLAVGTLLVRTRRAPLRMLQSSLLPPEKSAFSGAMELSPDGRRIAFVAPLPPTGSNVLWVRALNGLAAQPLTGTAGASYPFWSPDSRFLGFFADGRLKTIEASGGPLQTLCDAEVGRGGTWNREGTILFAPSVVDVIFRVSSSGGSPSPVTELQPESGEGGHRWPHFLPDGRHFLYLALGTGTGRLFVGSLDSNEQTPLVHARSSTAYAPPGYLLFHRENTLLARPFDAKRRRFTGEAVPVIERVHAPNTHKAAFSVSENGVLAYQAEGESTQTQLVWMDRGGKELEKVGGTNNYRMLRVSPDGRRVAVGVDERSALDLWLSDLARKTLSRFTFDPANEFSPVWSPDGRRIAFASNQRGIGDIYMKSSAGTGGDEPVLVSALLKIPTDWSSDGRFLAFQAAGRGTGSDLWIFSIADGKTSPYLQTKFAETAARFSPDGRYLAYVSNESGPNEVYVQPFPGPGGKWQISSSGGQWPTWSRNGREIFYVVPPNRLMSVDVRDGEAFEAGVPRLLFETPMRGGPGYGYDVSPDGQRFLVNTPTATETNSPINLVINWTAGPSK